MHRALTLVVGIAAVLLIGPPAIAQTSLPGDAIDVEIVNPVDGSNTFCVSSSEIFEARVYLRPGTGTLSCTLSCSPPSIPGGSSTIATGVVDVAFGGSLLSYVPASITSNPATAAAHGLPQEQNVSDGRIGWALAGSWSAPGNPSSSLLSPCDMEMVTTFDWLFSVQLQATGTGSAALHLRRETDGAPFALSFADICGSEAFKESNGGIDEVIDGMVLVNESCASLLFFDGFETRSTVRWSATSNP